MTATGMTASAPPVARHDQQQRGIAARSIPLGAVHIPLVLWSDKGKRLAKGDNNSEGFCEIARSAAESTGRRIGHVALPPPRGPAAPSATVRRRPVPGCPIPNPPIPRYPVPNAWASARPNFFPCRPVRVFRVGNHIAPKAEQSPAEGPPPSRPHLASQSPCPSTDFIEPTLAKGVARFEGEFGGGGLGNGGWRAVL